MGRHRGKTFLFQFVNRTSQLFNNSFCRKIWANPGLFLYVSSIFWTTKYHFQQKNWKADPNPGQQNVRPMDFGSLPPPFIHDSSKCPFQQFLYEWWGHKFLCVIHPDSLTSILKLFFVFPTFLANFWEEENIRCLEWGHHLSFVKRLFTGHVTLVRMTFRLLGQGRLKPCLVPGYFTL